MTPPPPDARLLTNGAEVRVDGSPAYIAVIGTNYVGLVTAACLAELGHQVGGVADFRHPDRVVLGGTDATAPERVATCTIRARCATSASATTPSAAPNRRVPRTSTPKSGRRISPREHPVPVY